MIRKETRIINGSEAHLYYDEERQVYLVAGDLMEEFLGLYENADKLVKELAEESNNGWIPCSERLPERVGQYIVCMEHCEFENLRSVCAKKWGDEWETPHGWKVIAWQMFPQIYKPKE